MSSLLRRLARPLEQRLKLRIAGEDIDALAEHRNRRRLRWLARGAESSTVRFRALRVLAEILDPEATDLFVELLEDEAGKHSPAVVRTAAEALGRLLNGDTAVQLRRLLSPNRPAGVQLAAARSLAMIGRDDDWGAIRAWTAQVDGVEQLLPDERDCVIPSKRSPAGTTPLVWVLETNYADKESRWWSSKASRWLESDDPQPRMASNKGSDKIVAQEHRHALSNKELDEEAFRRTALHLGSLARDRDHELLVQLVRAQSEAPRRRAAVQALGLQGDPRSVPIFEAWLAELPKDEVQLAGDLARAAGRLGWPELTPALVKLRSRFEEPEVRNNLAWAIGETGGEHAVRHLIDLVRSRDEELPDEEFQWIARSLVRCGVIGREAIRGSVAIARAGGGERDRVGRLAELAGIH